MKRTIPCCLRLADHLQRPARPHDPVHLGLRADGVKVQDVQLVGPQRLQREVQLALGPRGGAVLDLADQRDPAAVHRHQVLAVAFLAGLAAAVAERGVEVGDPQLDGPVDHPLGLGLPGHQVAGSAAEADRGDHQPGVAQRAHQHRPPGLLDRGLGARGRVAGWGVVGLTPRRRLGRRLSAAGWSAGGGWLAGRRLAPGGRLAPPGGIPPVTGGLPVGGGGGLFPPGAGSRSRPDPGCLRCRRRNPTPARPTPATDAFRNRRREMSRMVLPPCAAAGIHRTSPIGTFAPFHFGSGPGGAGAATASRFKTAPRGPGQAAWFRGALRSRMARRSLR